MNSRKVSRLLLILLLLMTSGMVFASTSPSVSRWVIGSGGGLAVASTTRITGMIGQSVAGQSVGGNVDLCSGFWCGHAGTYYIFLPLSLRNYIRMFPGPWEQEPNNSYLQANGSVYSGQAYYGYPNDDKDYFSFYMQQNGPIVIDLTGHTGQGVQLQLFYQGIDHRITYVSEPPFYIAHDGSAGWYYVYIYTSGGYNSTTPYTLHMTYQQ